MIIAEIGSNWERGDTTDENMAHAVTQIEKAAECGTDAVKFQLYTHKELYGYDGEMKGVLPKGWLPMLKIVADNNGLEFLCSAFSAEGFAAVDPFVKIHKVAGSDNCDHAILDAAYSHGKPVMLSLGAMNRSELIAAAREFKNTIWMECVSAYPANPDDYNIPMLKQMHGNGNTVGISDHTRGCTTAYAAKLAGAKYFEKHFDGLSDLGETPDSCVSAGVREFSDYCYTISGSIEEKYCTSDEVSMVQMHKRRLVAMKDIQPGDKFILGENFGSFRVKHPDPQAKHPNSIHDVNGRTCKSMLAITQGEGIWPSSVE